MNQSETAPKVVALFPKPARFKSAVLPDFIYG
jgi:hypothetical protein